MSSVKRLTKEFRSIQEDKIPGVEIELDGDDLNHWRGYIVGNEDTAYSGGIFKFEIVFPSDYPFKPPQFSFKTRVYHPGINDNGKICITELRDDQWKPANVMRNVLITIQEKLNKPQPTDEFEPQILQQLKEKPAEFWSTAQDWTKKYAMEPLD